jgi:hypothetical protein
MSYRSAKAAKDEIWELVRLTGQRGAFKGQALARLEAEHQKWSAIHEYLRAHPFYVSPRLPRSKQWRQALTKVRELREPELIDWICQQIHIATNLERGIRDMRPRRPGQCHEVIMIYTNDRVNKAEVVLNWNEAADDQVANLARRPSKVFMSDMRPAPKMDNPLKKTGSLWHEPSEDG